MEADNRQDEGAEEWICDSLFALGGVYQTDDDGKVFYYGQRPGAEWQGHGYFPKTVVMLVGAAPVAVVVWKHRWKNVETGRTVHSRPADDPVMLRYCTLILFLRVWAVVSSKQGFHNRAEVFEDLDDRCGSDRTVQRWTAKAMDECLEIQQAIRLAIIEKSEPRPIEQLFEGGLSPPGCVVSKRWQSPRNHFVLWLGYAQLLVGANKLGICTSRLLAEARRRWIKSKTPFSI